MYNLVFSHAAAKALEGLHRSDRRICARVVAALESLRVDPRLGKALRHELGGLRSLRVGSYRIIYSVEDRKLLVTVIDLGHRRDIYR